MQDPEANRLLGGMSEEERMASWHLVLRDGSIRSAGAAAGPLLRLLPGGAPIATLLERFPAATERAYRWIADRRGRFGRLVGRRALARADARIAASEKPRSAGR